MIMLFPDVNRIVETQQEKQVKANDVKKHYESLKLMKWHMLKILDLLVQM